MSLMDMANMKAVDLFCGAGGISTGLASAGFEIVAGIDIEAKFLASFKHNFPETLALNENVLDFSPAEFGKRIGIEPAELTLLAGGPPCQGFSKNVPRKYRYLEDPKNLLVKRFLDYCEHLRPKLVLMENVAEMKNGFGGQYTSEVVHRLEAAGYSVTHAVLNAADYGVPQRRRRAFFLADREGVALRVPHPTHLPSKSALPLTGEQGHVSVWDAIGDLPPVRHGEGQAVTNYATAPFSAYQKLVRNAGGSVKNHVARPLQPTQYERLASIGPGQGHADLPKHLQVKGGYSGAYGRLTKDMVAPTITRWVFHPGSGRFGHPVDVRTLTIREIARIQGFPDSFEFVGSFTQQAGQLGNAVPPLLAQRVVEDLLRQLAAQSASSTSVRRSNEIFSSSAGNLKLIA
ncbi:DNA cytosine methyltransferase [Novosphingobium bradum]|uniref:DNA (cytosine-5-)-methyltransferase n=2 Tax=Novosphingobium bradum TaxID=1737444 RepID=A0ABV7IQG9_9SPHN